MSYNVDSYAERLITKAQEAREKDPSLVLDDRTIRAAANSLASGPLQALEFLRTLPQEGRGVVCISVLLVLCDDLEAQDPSVRTAVLEHDVVLYIVSLLQAEGECVPCLRTTGARLLSALVEGQPSQALGHLVGADIVGILCSILKDGTGVTDPDLVQHAMTTLWYLYEACNQYDYYLYEHEVLDMLIDPLKSVQAHYAPTDDMRLAIIFNLIEHFTPPQLIDLRGKLVGVCVDMLEPPPCASNVVRQLLALCLIARISFAPTHDGNGIFDPDHRSGNKACLYFNVNCQVGSPDAFRTLLTAYAEFAQTISAGTKEEKFLMHKVSLRMLRTITRCQLFSDDAKHELLQTLVNLLEEDKVQDPILSHGYRSYIIDVRTRSNDKEVNLKSLEFYITHILSDEELITAHGADDLMCSLVEMNQKHLQHADVCRYAMRCIEMLLENGPYAQQNGLPDAMRMKIVSFISMANFLVLRQLGVTISTNRVLEMVVNSPADIKYMLDMNGNGPYLNKELKVSRLHDEPDRKEAEAAFIYSLPCKLAEICEKGGFRPPQSMVTAVQSFTDRGMNKVIDVLKTGTFFKTIEEPEEPEPCAQQHLLVLWHAVLFVCRHTKVEEARSVSNKMKDPPGQNDAYNWHWERLRGLLADIDAEASASLQLQELLLDELEKQDSKSGKRKSRNRRKKPAAGAEAADAVEVAKPDPKQTDAVAGAAGATNVPVRRVKRVAAFAGAAGATEVAKREPEPEQTDAFAGAAGATEVVKPKDTRLLGDCIFCEEPVTGSTMTVFVPCMHICYCLSCVETQQNLFCCPICRNECGPPKRLYNQLVQADGPQ